MATPDATTGENKNNVNYDKQKVTTCHTYQREIETQEVKKRVASETEKETKKVVSCPRLEPAGE